MIHLVNQLCIPFSIYQLTFIPEQAGDIKPIHISLIVVFSIMSVVGVIVSVRHYRKKSTAYNTTAMEWEKNCSYDSDDEEEAVSQNEIMPNWLKIRPDMIYPETSVYLTVELGSGQFGSVYKGQLVQSRSV